MKLRVLPGRIKCPFRNFNISERGVVREFKLALEYGEFKLHGRRIDSTKLSNSTIKKKDIAIDIEKEINTKTKCNYL
jgi:hypothetical protein